MVPTKLAPVTLPVALTVPPVAKLPAVAVFVTLKLPSVPTDVMLVCAAVNNVPVKLVALTLPPVMLPVAFT